MMDLSSIWVMKVWSRPMRGNRFAMQLLTLTVDKLERRVREHRVREQLAVLAPVLKATAEPSTQSLAQSKVAATSRLQGARTLLSDLQNEIEEAIAEAIPAKII